MNSIFSRTLKALCTVVAAALLSACGGASSTVDPFVATRVIAFGDGFNNVDANGSGLSTVRTTDTAATPIVYVTDDTIAGRIAARYGIVVKPVTATGGANPLAATGGFSYATANARVSDVATATTGQIDTFLASAGGAVAKKDLIIIAVGNWDIYYAVIAGATSMDANTTALVAAIQRLTSAGAEHVVVMPPINMARTPWATTYVTAHPSTTRTMIQNLSNSAASSFNFSLLAKLTTAYRQDHKPVVFLDRTTDFNSFAGSVAADGSTVGNYSGISLTNLSTAVCTTASPAAGCNLSVGAGGLINATDYLTSVFADEINLTPLINRYFADRMIASLVNFGWAP
jgi:phospholipase/lecithinase/hemolysin